MSANFMYSIVGVAAPSSIMLMKALLVTAVAEITQQSDNLCLGWPLLSKVVKNPDVYGDIPSWRGLQVRSTTHAQTNAKIWLFPVGRPSSATVLLKFMQNLLVILLMGRQLGATNIALGRGNYLIKKCVKGVNALQLWCG